MQHQAEPAAGQSVQRYFDPAVGRLLSVDPVEIESGDLRHFNRYAYAFSNPYSFTDPDGRDGQFVALRGFIGFVAADAATPDPSDAAAPGKAAVYGSAIVGLAVGGGILWAVNEAPGSGEKEPTPGAVDLVDDLAAQEAAGKIEAGEGKVLTGMGDSRFDPETGTHDKVEVSRDNADGTQTKVHADRNRQTGEADNVKVKQQGPNCRAAAGCGE